jgi:pimeloyl-ACP methyl ester carboxylesterase
LLIARWLLAAAALLLCGVAAAQDHEREARWAEQTLATLVAGDAVWLTQKSGHRFLALHLPAKQPRGAVIVAHGRGWAPDHDLYGALRTRLADAGYSTLSIQLPVLPGTAKVGDYLPTFPDADERFALAAAWLREQGHGDIAIVSHSLGATMANHYLIRAADSPVRAWVFIGIINGLEDMFRIRIPVLDVFGEQDWDITRVGAGERLAQIARIPGSQQVVVKNAQHFFEGRDDELARVIVGFLDHAFRR